MKSEKKRQVKGSVLFTVVCVMSILIIFLTGTLVLAASANRRSHRSYSSSQTEYTARAAIESFTAAMERNPDIVGAIQNITPGTPLHPTIVINDSSMGQIGYYDAAGNFVEDKISVECLPSSEDQYYYTTTGGWMKLNVVKITATAELGGEESTVVAYIRKKAPNEITGKTIKGLQTAGGAVFSTTEGHFTGALVLGMTDPENNGNVYEITNGTKFDTDLNYVNGSLHVFNGSGLEININTKDTETIIDGSFTAQNSTLVNVNYTMNADFTQQDVPYLYIDEVLYVTNQLNLVQGNRSPFNVFVGTTYHNSNTLDINGDLYLMDEVDGSTYTFVGETFQKGKNRIGEGGTSDLVAWTNSVYNKTDAQFKSNGGNIYCMGDLEIKETNVNGDLRVKGNLVINGEVTVTGNIVVGGSLTVNGTLNTGASTQVYVGGAVTGYGSGPSVNAGFEEKDNILHEAEYVANTGYERVDNIQYPYYKFTATEMMPDYSGMKGLFGENLGWTNDVSYYFAQGAYDPTIDYSTYTADQMQTVIDESLGYQPYLPEGSVFYREVDGFGTETNNVTDTKYWFYDQFDASRAPVTDMSICATYVEPYYTEVNYDGTDSGVVTTESKSYFETATGARVPVTTAVTFGGIYPISAFSGEIYPSAMTREQIRGDGDESNKIIKTLEEVQEEIAYNPSTGNFDPNIYYKEIPASVDQTRFKKWDESGVRTDEGTYYQINASAGTLPGVIIDSDIDKDLHIKPDGQIWFVIEDGVSFRAGRKIIVDDSNGSVNFFIKGEFKLSNESAANTMIITKELYDRLTGGDKNLYENDNIGIVYYGAEGSSITYQNNCTLFGTAKAPYTQINGITTGANGITANVIYHANSGQTVNLGSNGAHWVGSALVGGIAESFNNFTLAYTKAGGLGLGAIETEAGTYVFNYFDQY